MQDSISYKILNLIISLVITIQFLKLNCKNQKLNVFIEYYRSFFISLELFINVLLPKSMIIQGFIFTYNDMSYVLTISNQ